jgi:integrase/recombinase XerD
MAVTVYIREKGGKQKFTRAPEGPTDAQYWLSACQAGKQKWHRVGKYEDVKKAKFLLERELERVAAAKKYGFPVTEAPGRITVKDAVTKYLERKRIAGKRPGTLASYRFTLSLFEDFCTRLYVDEIIGDDLLDFCAFCKKRKDADRTISRRFVDMTIFMKFYGKSRLVPKTDWPTYIERPVEAYSQEQIEKFDVAALSNSSIDKTQKESLLLELLLHTGFRIGEIAHLTYPDIDFAGNKISVKPNTEWHWVPKTQECRIVRVPQKVMDNLKAWHDSHPGTLVFPSTVGKPDGHLLRIIKDLGKRAGIKGRFDCHKFRSTFATQKSGQFKIQDVQKMLGHKSIETTMRYLEATSLDDPEFVAKIEAGSKVKV